MVAQDDRDMGAGIVLWKLIPECFILTGGALERLIEVFAGLRVEPARMRANLDASGGLMASEAVMLRLAKRYGREHAHALVSRLVDDSLREGTPFADALRQDPDVAAAITPQELTTLLDPSTYLGQTSALVDRALGEPDDG